jgi:hypothetical protein
MRVENIKKKNFSFFLLFRYKHKKNKLHAKEKSFSLIFFLLSEIQDFLFFFVEEMHNWKHNSKIDFIGVFY